jgi:hypothetical protein
MDEKTKGIYCAGILCVVAFALLAYKAYFSYVNSQGSMVEAYAVLSGFFGVLGFGSLAMPHSKIGQFTAFILRNVVRRTIENSEENQQEQESQES